MDAVVDIETSNEPISPVCSSKVVGLIKTIISAFAEFVPAANIKRIQTNPGSWCRMRGERKNGGFMVGLSVGTREEAKGDIDYATCGIPAVDQTSFLPRNELAAV